MLNKLLLVGIGGFTGSILRYLMYQVFDKPILAFFPFATFTVNIIGSFLIGIIYFLAQKEGWVSEEIRLLLAVGFCGSFTTFSTFALENLTLIKSGNLLTTVVYIGSSVVLSIIAVWAGYSLFK